MLLFYPFLLPFKNHWQNHTHAHIHSTQAQKVFVLFLNYESFIVNRDFVIKIRLMFVSALILRFYKMEGAAECFAYGHWIYAHMAMDVGMRAVEGDREKTEQHTVN